MTDTATLLCLPLLGVSDRVFCYKFSSNSILFPFNDSYLVSLIF